MNGGACCYCNAHADGPDNGADVNEDVSHLKVSEKPWVPYSYAAVFLRFVLAGATGGSGEAISVHVL
jgi:hypothetical protein